MALSPAVTLLTQNFRDKISAPRLRRYLMVWAISVAVFAISGTGAFLLRFDLQIRADEQADLLWALSFWIPCKTLAFAAFRVNRIWRRYASLPDLLRIGAALLSSAVVSTAAIAVLRPSFPRSVYILDLLVSLVTSCGLCVAERLSHQWRVSRHHGERTRVLIYGGGSAGEKLIRDLRVNPQLGYEVVGVIDDDPLKIHGSLHGFRILGNAGSLKEIVKQRAVRTVLVAMPSADGGQMSRVLEACERAGAGCKTIPSVSEIVQGRGLARQIREIALEDLLGRTPIRLEQESIAALLARRTVLVTGAAGSIGSELCRQIARFDPAAIVALDIAETALYYLELEMHQRFPSIPFHAEVGSVCDEPRLAEIFTRFLPAAVFHAAAYKHVPMMEHHLFSAVENNILGTANVAATAAAYAVEHCVMISTDKAVRPTSVMGVTKRVAEILISSLAGETRYVSVRFGNVLGSNGSVVPIFRKQISEGGPVTVTHPDMKRYFMTIPEASQLVLQAAAMGRGGEIFILDMGQPVCIAELARKLIRLSGLRPDIDIQITYTGIRPGEKLYEELSGAEEGVLATHHEKIRVYQGRRTPEEEMQRHITSLRYLCKARDREGVLRVLKTI
ncbi:MAG: polysaccharide biosynthesis protein, partial [Acidobacteriaceae bacterium]|nr:polysaccharide biosynthesis protein [Acidobacteriaceae bacterium]